MMNAVRLMVLGTVWAGAATGVHAEETKSVGTASFCCIYQHKVKTVDLNQQAVTDSTAAMLEVGDNVAKYGDWAAYHGQLPANYDTKNLAGNPWTKDYVTVYQDYPQQGKLTVREGLLPHFYVYEEEPKLVWTPVEGTDTVLGHVCSRAVTTYGGRTWTASYAADIPMVYGPWKLTGLPGLILKAESADGIHSFVAQVLYDIDAQAMAWDGTEKDVKVARNKFVTLRNRLKTDKQWPKSASYYVNAEDIRSVVIVKDHNHEGLTPNMSINGISLPMSGGTGHFFQPLETK